MAGLCKSWAHSSALAAFCLCLCFSLGCERSEPSPPGTDSAAGTQSLPFHPGSDLPSREVPVSTAPNSQLAGNLPFHDRSRTLPAGSFLTVQLKDSLSSTKIHPGYGFTASVAVPLTMGGNTLIDRGTEVSGQVESARSRLDPSQPADSSGYIRLRLTALNLSGREIPLETSSLFARGIVQGSGGVRLAKGRHLTFRLTAPVGLEEANTMAKGQPSAANTQ